MPFLLRKVRQNRWYKVSPPWLPQGELQADPIGDLATQANNLSVWHVKDDQSNLNDVIAALAGTVNTISNFDYILFDEQVLSELSFKLSTSVGKTPHVQANVQWHRDVIQLSAQNLIKLAEVLLARYKTQRKGWKEVLNIVSDAVYSGQVDRENLQSNLKPEDMRQIDELIVKKKSKP